MTSPLVNARGSNLRLDLRLSTKLDQSTRERCPDVAFQHGPDVVAVFRADEPAPKLDAPDGAFRDIDAADAISRVIDEEAWLRELGRVLAPGGTLRFVLPSSGPLAWVDARNIYRYITDITGRGDAPDDALPTGWNRHYSEKAVHQMLDVAGMRVSDFRRSGVGVTEVVQLAGFMGRNFVLGCRGAELKLHPVRRRMEAGEQRFAVPKVGTMLHVEAMRPRE